MVNDEWNWRAIQAEEDEPPLPVTKEGFIASLNHLLKAMNQLPNPSEDDRVAMLMFLCGIALLQADDTKTDEP